MGASTRGMMARFDFDKVSRRYDEWYETPLGEVHDRIQKRAVAEALGERTEGRRMLEIGCGTGHWTQFFSELGFEVLGVDLSFGMLRVAQSKGIERTRLALADASRLPFSSGSFDVGCAITTLEFVSDAQAALRELARCVRPGGRIVVGVLNRASLLAWLRRRRGSPTFRDARLMTVGELRGLLAGFGDASVFSTGFVLPWRGLLWLSRVSNAVGRVLRLPFGDFLVGTVRIEQLER
ncbi:MAG: ubiquinone biosynthesis protein UbiE [Candidatus Coatesbacteria bacterium]|nr:MAG: ubiquinone biosynthesis protein UbiE [Candidatus Coatesbacteria bacterium]